MPRAIDVRRLLRPRRGAYSILLCATTIIAVIAFVSLAVDVGRLRFAKTELQCAADAASRAGARGLPDSSNAAQQNALKTAAANLCVDSTASGFSPVQIQLNGD